jgi:hypothetical protein
MLAAVRVYVMACLAATLLAACASVNLAQSQRNPDYAGPALTRVMVIGVSTNARVRRAFEDGWVAQLKAAGVAAVPSYPLLPNTGEAQQARLWEVVKGAGVDGVLVARKVPVEQDIGALAAFNFADRTSDFSEVESAGGDASAEPIQGNAPAFITVQFNLYSVAGAKKVWSAVTTQMPSDNLVAASAGYAAVVIKSLRDQKLI